MTDYPRVRAHLQSVRDRSLAAAEDFLSGPPDMFHRTHIDGHLRTAERAQHQLDMLEKRKGNDG